MSFAIWSSDCSSRDGLRETVYTGSRYGLMGESVSVWEVQPKGRVHNAIVPDLERYARAQKEGRSGMLRLSSRCLKDQGYRIEGGLMLLAAKAVTRVL